LSLFLLKGIDGEVGTHRTEYRTQDLEMVCPCRTPGVCDLLCSKHTTSINRTLGCPSFLAASSLLVFTELKVKETLQFNFASCYSCCSKSSHPTFSGFFGPKFRCLHYFYSHLFEQSSRQRSESNDSDDGLMWVCGL